MLCNVKGGTYLETFSVLKYFLIMQFPMSADMNFYINVLNQNYILTIFKVIKNLRMVLYKNSVGWLFFFRKHNTSFN